MSYTQEEFMEISSWFELKEFCDTYDLSSYQAGIDLEYILDDFCLREDIRELVSSCMWDDIYSLTANLYNSPYEDNYYYDFGGGLSVLGDDHFEEAKEATLIDFRNNGYTFDDEEGGVNEIEVLFPDLEDKRWVNGRHSVYGAISIQPCYSSPDVTGCSEDMFNKIFSF